MIENITVTDKNKNEIFAEGISHIQHLSSGKKNLLYTLNEPAQNDTIKMYVAELTDVPGSLGKIPDEEWVKLRKDLEKIERGEINPDIKYLSLANTTFNIGIPKKLAITPEVKQSFKDKQAAGLLANQQKQMTDAPAVESSTGGFFNKEEVNQTPAYTSPEDTQQDQVNIFNNPMKPEVVLTQPAGGVIEQGVVQGIGQQGGTQMVGNVMPQGQTNIDGEMMTNPQMVMPVQPPMPTPAVAAEQQGQVMMQTAQASSLANESAAADYVQSGSQTGTQMMEEGNNTNVDNPFIVNPMPALNGDNNATNVATALETASLVDTGNSIQYQQGLATNLSNDLGVATGITPKDNEKEVSKEEALEALEILNRYFKNTKELPSSLANELNNQMQTENKENNAMVQQGTENDMSSMKNGINELSSDSQSNYSTQVEPMPMVDAGIMPEQGRTLSLVPEGTSSVGAMAIDTSSSEVVSNIPQDNNQMSAMNTQMLENTNIIPGPGFDNQMVQANQASTGYVASSNGPAVNMSVAPTNINDVPVTLPDNYNPQANAQGNIVMGPGSLPAENYTKVA